ncbi:MAG: cytidine [Planctomycetota bacterium]|nr:MAG: cytidine [Planctomycetota bacterium]
MKSTPLTKADRELVLAARGALRADMNPRRHGVGCAIRGESGRVYVGVNVEACGYGPCAEPIALGSAIAAGERRFESVVAVVPRGKGAEVLSPCGNCRQLFLDYAPDAWIIVRDGKREFKARAKDLLPAAYRSGFAVKAGNRAGRNGK